MSRSDRVARNVLLGVMPVLAILSYVFAINEMLLFIALFVPLLIFTDGTVEARKRAWRDPLTGLPDADSLTRALGEELDASGTFNRTACLVIEMDNVIELRRKWGQSALDQAIGETASRIQAVLRSCDDIARVGETSFGVMLTGLRSPETSAVVTMCGRIMETVGQPIAIDDASMHLSVSIGFCLDNRAKKRTGESMMDCARDALVEARQNAPEGLRSYSSMTLSPQDSDLSADAVLALQRGEIQPWFQPQISTDTGEITGFEALARWEHPERGTLPPDHFVPALEEAGQLEELGEAILNHALRALVAWDKAGLHVPSVAVNFATQELRNPSLVERIKWDVDRFELSPERLTVEVLETVISEHDDDIITRNIRALGAQGFRIDLDDFGTGHASLANIRRFSVDRIKIDRSFCIHVDEDPEQQRMIAAIIGLGERLGVETLAEGVENIGEQSILSQLGCNHLQGFAIARPMPFEKTIDWITQHTKSTRSAPVIGRKAG